MSLQKLRQLNEGEYLLGNYPVSPKLVYGPIMYTYDDNVDFNHEKPMDTLVEQVRRETGVDLEKIANSYHSGIISVEQDGKKTMHELLMFFNSSKKPMN